MFKNKNIMIAILFFFFILLLGKHFFIVYAAEVLTETEKLSIVYDTYTTKQQTFFNTSYFKEAFNEKWNLYGMKWWIKNYTFYLSQIYALQDPVMLEQLGTNIYQDMIRCYTDEKITEEQAYYADLHRKINYKSAVYLVSFALIASLVIVSVSYSYSFFSHMTRTLHTIDDLQAQVNNIELQIQNLVAQGNNLHNEVAQLAELLRRAE